MKLTLMVLLCLFYALVVVYSQEVPYISFMDTNLSNHSYIDLNLVGEDSRDGVQCHTDLITCCIGQQGPDRGDWYYPNGDVLNFSKGTFKEFQSREVKRVVLRRRGSQPLTQGVYWCDIETNAVNNQSGKEIIYAGLYTTGGSVSISNGVQFIKDSDLNGESPQFTLICISTGGPATTVTWTRDSEEISGGMTVLDNATTAQYTHTVTVTGRLGGQYVCNVTNGRPSQASANYTVKVASTPTNLMAVKKDTTGIQVSWTPPTPLGDTTGYRIYYSGGGSGSVNVSGGSTNSHLLTDLKNGATYTISIVGISEHFFSDSVDYPNSIPLRSDSCLQTQVEHTKALGGGVVGGFVVGGFVGGVLLTAALGVVIFVVLLQRKKTKVDTSKTSPGFASENKDSTSINLSYGHIEGVKAAEYEMCVMPSGAAMATQEPAYETVST